MIRLITAAVLLLLTASLTTAALAKPHLLMDLETGRVLSSEEAFVPWHPASLTKVMTAYVVFEAIDAGTVSLSDTVRMTRLATRQPPSRMGYRAGTLLSIESALKLLIVKSANDVSVALAEAVSGSVENFASRMNQTAARLGMTDSRFTNPHGLHDKRQVITARDFGLLLKALHERHPRYADYFKAPAVLAQKRNKEGKLIERAYYSYNLLLERFRGADGFKTGFVCASGYNFAGSATRGGQRLAAIVLGRSSQKDRAEAAARLLSEGFQLPAGSGTPIEELKASANVRRTPPNMRSVLCTEEARAKRYEPGAGLAVIDSPWMQKRTKQAINLRAPLMAGMALARVTVPKFRPNYAAPTPIDGGVNRVGGTPTPSFRPSVSAFN